APGAREPAPLGVPRLCLAHGITTVRNPMAPTREGVALRAAGAAGRVPGPRIFTAGWPISGRRSAPTREGSARREAVAAGRVPGPRIFTAGWTINGPQFATEEQVRKEVR